jgi:hypothetical protein
MTEPDAWIWKCRGCPTCEGEKTAQIHGDKHAEIGGEFFELLPERPTARDFYSDSDVDELMPLFSADTIDSDLIELEEEIMNREHGKLSYKHEPLVRAVLFTARQRFKEDAEPFPETENLEDKVGQRELDYQGEVDAE